jgi:hypothetical protein
MWQFLRARKKLWLPPLAFMVVVALVLIGINVGARLAPVIHAYFR